MEFFQGRGRCSEDEEVDMIGGMDKLPYNSSSSSSNGRWGSQFYEEQKNHKIWLSERESAARFNYDHQSGSSSEVHHKRGDSDDGVGVGGSGVGGAEEEEEEEVVCIEREHMFDKVVTPSDVGKLNRLVIPKQHAEKYFPLDSTANEKGLLLNFEDRSGKPWRFRYSYWNSSQSYVMTKGWSRFVKEKKLYAGDIVSFQRGAGESVKDRLYIDWRRRSDVREPATLPPLPLLHPLSFPRSATWGGLILPPNMPMPMHMHMPMPMSMPVPRGDMVWQRMNYGHIHNPNQHHHMSSNGYNVANTGSSPMFYLRSPSSQQGGDRPMVYNSVPVVHGKASAKRLRLFGVNLECPTPENTEYQFLDPAAVQPLPPPALPPLELSLYNTESPSREHNQENASMSLDLDM